MPDRRVPRQLRSQQTVEAVLDAVTRVIKRDGVGAVTTNRIAEAAGVSIGSVYQYFPDKQAIFRALHQRHVQQMGRLVDRTLVDHAESSLEQLMRALVSALIRAHAEDPELYELLHAEVPADRHGGFAKRLQAALRLAITAQAPKLVARQNLDRVLFVVTHMIASLTHAVLRRPSRLSLAAAEGEIVRAVLAYLRD